MQTKLDLNIYYIVEIAVFYHLSYAKSKAVE